MTAPFVILACGNPSRGDDALGPLLLARLDAWLAAEGLAERFELIEDFQFQVEHALDLQGRRAALFIDAGTETPGPYTLLPLAADDTPGHSTHAITPVAVLAVYRRVVGEEAPPAHVLCVRGEHFELGEALSAAAGANLEAAWEKLQEFCHELLQSPAASEKR
ncbi:MAG: hydrogenase maturation protease [Rhodocyclales bacterium]|nr:hydrogenase maturation protease [Rhodocyclales bacterium]